MENRGAGGAALYQMQAQYRRPGANPSINGDHIEGELSVSVLFVVWTQHSWPEATDFGCLTR